MALKNLKMGKSHVVTGKVNVPNAMVSGLGWYVVRENGRPTLHYLTGANPEREDIIVLTDEEFARLNAAGEDGHEVVTGIANARYNARHGLA